MMTKSILLVGVGGQGTILASKILTLGLSEKGYDVKMSEIHGMSQRGGSVTSQIRYGEVVNSPVIGLGEADLLVAFEEMEAYRWVPYLKPTGKVILNEYRIPSMPMLLGKIDYPEGMKEEILERIPTTCIPASKEALKINAPRSMNMVLLGALIKSMNLVDIDWKKIFETHTKPQFLESNLKALELGMNYL